MVMILMMMMTRQVRTLEGSQVEKICTLPNSLANKVAV